jgi:hypothetical protein
MGYLSSLDFLDKNADKIAHPKGTQGSASAFASMY